MTAIGFHASHEQVSPSELLQAVRAAEAAGFSGATRAPIGTVVQALSNSNVATVRKLNWFFIEFLVKVASDKYTSCLTLCGYYSWKQV